MKEVMKEWMKEGRKEGCILVDLEGWRVEKVGWLKSWRVEKLESWRVGGFIKV